MKWWILLAVVYAYSLAPLKPAIAGTWNVPSPECPTIQAGLDSAAMGDTVRVAPGDYFESLFWPFRNGIVLIGSGMDETYVIGDGSESVLLMVEAVEIDTTTVARDLCFRAGGDAGVVLYGTSPLLTSCAVDSTRNGPGIHCLEGSEAHIRDCLIQDNAGTGIRIDGCDSNLVISTNVITSNTAPEEGGGIHCHTASPTILGNIITENSSSYGGGICCEYGSSPLIAGNDVSANVSTVVGGGLYCQESSSPTIHTNTITSNSTDWGGGGIQCSYHCEPEIADNIIDSNTALQYGGGIHCHYGSSAAIVGNAITRNTALDGGGIHSRDGSAEIEGNEIISNNALGSGGGIFSEGGWPIITGNTIARNTAALDGGGIFAHDGLATLSSNRIIGNTASGCGGGIKTAISGEISLNIIAANRASGDGGGIHCAVSFSSVLITGNTMTRNEAAGNGGALLCEGSGPPTLTFNTVTENTSEGLGNAIYSEDSSTTLYNCNIAYNGVGLHNASYQTVPVAQDNWWGHETGPWHEANPGGLGDSLSTYAWDFTPWLAEADTAAPPLPPMNLTVDGTGEDYLVLSWMPVPLSDLSGYRVHFDSDSTGLPYGGMCDVGNVTQTLLPGLEAGTTYYLAVTSYDIGGDESWYSDEVEAVTNSPAHVPGPHEQKASLRLEPAYPNPFHSQTTVSFVVPTPGRVRLLIHDLQGRRLITLANMIVGTGRHTVVWGARDENKRRAVPGIYFVRLEYGGEVQTRKIVLAN